MTVRSKFNFASTASISFSGVDDPVGDEVTLSAVVVGFSGLVTNPMTTQDDLIVGGVGGAPTRLGKGGDGQVLTVDPITHHLVWAADPDFVSPMTTQDDLIVGGVGGAATRLAKGADAQVLTVDPVTHHLFWATPGPSSPTAFRARVRQAGNFILPGDDLFHAIGNMTVVDYDPNGNLSGTGVYTAPQTGPYLVTAGVGGAGAGIWAGVSKNGNGIATGDLMGGGGINGSESPGGGGGSTGSLAVDVLNLVAGDTLTLCGVGRLGGFTTTFLYTHMAVIFQH